MQAPRWRKTNRQNKFAKLQHEDRGIELTPLMHPAGPEIGFVGD
jgi:hypothetical protein